MPGRTSSALAVALGMSFFPLALTWVYPFLMGSAMGGFLALSFALPLQYVEPRLVGSVAGANLLVGYGGTFAGPVIIGWVHDLTGGFTGGWLLVIASIVLLMVTAWRLPKQVY